MFSMLFLILPTHEVIYDCLPELKKTFSGDASQFKNKYGRDMPPKDAVIIFTCKAGTRASNAAAVAKELGFSNSKVYQGSWDEWSQKSKK